VCAAKIASDREGVADVVSPLAQIKADLRGCITRARDHRMVQLYTQCAGDFQGLVKSALAQSGPVQRHGNEAIDGRWFDAGETLAKQIREDRRMCQSVRVFQAMNQLVDGRGIGDGGDGRVKRRRVGLTGAAFRRCRRVRQRRGAMCAGGRELGQGAATASADLSRRLSAADDARGMKKPLPPAAPWSVNHNGTHWLTV